MQIRRLASIASTCVVAIVMVLALPFAQLAVAAPTAPACCCPQPAHCKCPDHQRAVSLPPTVRTCHPAAHASSQPLPAFAAPARTTVVAPARAVAIVAIPLAAPHVPPVLDRRDAPS